MTIQDKMDKILKRMDKMEEEHDMKLCKNCKWSKPYRVFFVKHYENARCKNPIEINKKIDLVTGKSKQKFNSCSSLRFCSDMCGEQAKWFEPKGK